MTDLHEIAQMVRAREAAQARIRPHLTWCDQRNETYRPLLPHERYALWKRAQGQCKPMEPGAVRTRMQACLDAGKAFLAMSKRPRVLNAIVGRLRAVRLAKKVEASNVVRFERRKAA